MLVDVKYAYPTVKFWMFIKFMSIGSRQSVSIFSDSIVVMAVPHKIDTTKNPFRRHNRKSLKGKAFTKKLHYMLTWRTGRMVDMEISLPSKFIYIFKNPLFDANKFRVFSILFFMTQS